MRSYEQKLYFYETLNYYNDKLKRRKNPNEDFPAELLHLKEYKYEKQCLYEEEKYNFNGNFI